MLKCQLSLTVEKANFNVTLGRKTQLLTYTCIIVTRQLKHNMRVDAETGNCKRSAGYKDVGGYGLYCCRLVL